MVIDKQGEQVTTVFHATRIDRPVHLESENISKFDIRILMANHDHDYLVPKTTTTTNSLQEDTAVIAKNFDAPTLCCTTRKDCMHPCSSFTVF